jgi:hypothetical protein
MNCTWREQNRPTIADFELTTQSGFHGRRKAAAGTRFFLPIGECPTVISGFCTGVRALQHRLVHFTK